MCRLTTPTMPTRVILTVTLTGSENFSTGRTSLSGNKFSSSALTKDLGVGLVQFSAATKPEFKKTKYKNVIGTKNSQEKKKSENI